MSDAKEQALQNALAIVKEAFCEKAGISELNYEVMVVCCAEGNGHSVEGLHKYTQLNGGSVYYHHDKDTFSEIRIAATEGESAIVD